MLVTQSSRSRFDVIRRLLPICLCALLCAGGAVARGQQQYTELDVDMSLESQENAVTALIRGSSLNTTQQQQVNKFFTTYSFPRWTRLADGSELADYRRELVDDIRRSSGASRDYMLQITYNYFKSVSESSAACPPARYNAVLLIGELNQAEGPTSTVLPTAYAPAAPFLHQTLQNENAPDFLRLAALIGLERHAYIGIENAQLRDSQVLPLLLTIAQADTPTGNRADDIHHWFRWRAIRALGNAGTPGANDVYLKALGMMGKDAELAPTLRYEAIRALGRMDYTQTQAIKPVHLISMMSEAALLVIQDEVDAINERILASQAGTGGMGMDMGSEMGMGMDMGMGSDMGSGMGGTASRDLDDSKRRVLHGFGSVLTALGTKGRSGIREAIVETIDEDNADDLAAVVNEFVQFCDDNGYRMTEQALTTQLFNTRQEIEKLGL
jgi:hypothetical protein